jgi:integrase
MEYEDQLNNSLNRLSTILIGNKPNLSPSSVKTYLSILKSIYNNTKSSSNQLDFDYFINNCENILSYLEQFKPSSRKTKLAALVVLTMNDESDCADRYRSVMIKDAQSINNINKKTDKEKDNWMSQNDIITLYKDLERKYQHLLSSRGLKQNDLYALMDYIILSLYVLIEPRRLSDYTYMKLRNYDEDKDNYYKNGKFYFNIYKTAKTYGKQEIQLPKKLRNIINKWSRLHTNDYLLFNKSNNKLYESMLNKKLNSIFDDSKISVNMLRHIFLTDKYKDVVEDMKQTAKNMGHSTEEQQLYIKDD